ncbi:FecR domain-containing protein [Sphingomonas sp. R-74633]|uniref:FecR family protein n=1 Tax=Sphingomonas sp. R-74633 TaxID=2751188 RepID=UPI0015D1953D|nr:FecR domain-containing protein [Sphingomonas sp. R-74633]NYT41918.1 FecR domain-containing protein [Sphingomonas sp. R-74633]
MQIETDEDGAARWAIRLDADALDASEQAALDSWLSVSAGRAGALLRAQATLSYLDRGRALAGMAADEIEPDVARGWRPHRRALLAGAGGLAAALVALGWFRSGDQLVDTGIGELRRVPLADGSLATLNTRTRMQVDMIANQRTIRLEDGEAWFRVAHDKARPFVVEVGDIRVRAIGTAFSVRRREKGAEVLVTEGTIETWVVGQEARAHRISAGSRGFVPSIRAEIEVATAPQEIDRALAWRSGELALDGETLAYAAEELNRYNVRQLVISDPKLREEPLVGYFRTTEPENFARAVATMVDARVVTEGDTIRIEKMYL